MRVLVASAGGHRFERQERNLHHHGALRHVELYGKVEGSRHIYDFKRLKNVGCMKCTYFINREKEGVFHAPYGSR